MVLDKIVMVIVESIEGGRSSSDIWQFAHYQKECCRRVQTLRHLCFPWGCFGLHVSRLPPPPAHKLLIIQVFLICAARMTRLQECEIGGNQVLTMGYTSDEWRTNHGLLVALTHPHNPSSLMMEIREMRLIKLSDKINLIKGHTDDY